METRKRLRREHKDPRVCAICGRPAARYGRTFIERHGEDVWFGFEPLSVDVRSKEDDPLAVPRAVPQEPKVVTEFGRQRVEPVPPKRTWVVEYGWICTRDDPLKKPHDPSDPLTYPSCGMLSDAQTRRADRLPITCFVDDTDAQRPDIEGLADSMRLSFSDADGRR